MAEVLETMDVGVVEHVLSDGYAKMQPTRDLINGDPAHESVTAVAYRWGFPSASRFTAYYRQAYGVLPATPCASEARRSVRHALMRTRSLSAGGIRVMAVTGGRQ